MPSPEAREVALLLVRKAEGDEFHEVGYDRTHSINYLTSMLEQHGIDLPTARDEIERLTPWAVAARYEDDFQRVLDRAAARQAVSDVREWSRGLLEG